MYIWNKLHLQLTFLCQESVTKWRYNSLRDASLIDRLPTWVDNATRDPWAWDGLWAETTSNDSAIC